MAYEPTNWQTGDIVTAEKLNKLENGVANSDGGAGSSTLVATFTYNETDGIYTLDKSWQDIKDTVDAGGIVVAKGTYNEASGAITTDIWYMTSFASGELSVGYMLYMAMFRNFSNNEQPTFYATDSNALLTTEDPNPPA